MHLQQKNFENIVANREKVHEEQFLHMPKCLQLKTITTIAFLKNPYFYREIFNLKSSAADHLYVGKDKEKFRTLLKSSLC